MRDAAAFKRATQEGFSFKLVGRNGDIEGKVPANATGVGAPRF